eukprot:gene15260-biopygen13500
MAHWPAQDGRGGTSRVQSPLASGNTLSPVTVIARYCYRPLCYLPLSSPRRYRPLPLSPVTVISRYRPLPLSPVTVTVRHRYHRYR